MLCFISTSLHCLVRISLSKQQYTSGDFYSYAKMTEFFLFVALCFSLIFFFLSVTQVHWSVARMMPVCQRFYTHHATPFTQNYRICFATVFLLIINWQCVLEMYSELQQTAFLLETKRTEVRVHKEILIEIVCDTIASHLNGIQTFNTFTQSDFVSQRCQLELHCKSQLSGWLA